MPQIKPSERPVEKADDPYRLVSAVDCRFMAFECVSEATRLWIKGCESTVARLLGDAYKDEAERYTGGALAIFRLAPACAAALPPLPFACGRDDRDLFFAESLKEPQAIRTALDVYGENARKIVPINGPQFRKVTAEGESVKREQEFGYFAFGGSAIVLLFERDMVE
ncbi:hypothetical protein R3P38DRAFT_3195815 [Favolaschia claudopus]|uniref:Uncharacterized protein n=1 Tax=Favolaschia claudopus TaxID=2862362 RepID=A0AAW0B9X3_9AGAR